MKEQPRFKRQAPQVESCPQALWPQGRSAGTKTSSSDQRLNPVVKQKETDGMTTETGMVERAKLLIATEALSKAASAMKAEAYVLHLAGYAPSVVEALNKRADEAIRAIDAALSPSKGEPTDRLPNPTT